jgi:tetratricopeptide (TPR) repeat protein
LTTQPEPPPPDYPRYTYRRPQPPAPGDFNTANAWFARGLEAQRDGRLMDALQAYQAAIQANPAFFEAYYNFALAALHAGRIRDALDASEYALALNPNSRDARYNFALALRQGGFYLDAAEELERLLTRHPLDTRARLALANLYAQQLRQPARARLHYQRLLELDPRHPEAEAIRYWLAQHPG